MRTLLSALVLLSAGIALTARAGDSALEQSVRELRDALGTWLVTTEFLNEDGSIAQTAEGSYEFDWVIEDRVLQGRMEIPAKGLASAMLFYVREQTEEIEMVSVGKDGRLWIMTGPLGGDTRHSQPFPTQAGGEGQLRFTRFNV